MRAGTILASAAALACATALAAGAGGAAAASCTPTVAQTEGPYYKAGPPERADIAGGAAGHPLAVSGVVRDTACRPVAGARVDVWQADGTGAYDNTGYRLRGWTTTDSRGRYRVLTVFPGLYPGRTRHIHVKVSAPGGPVLTTQLYFPGEPENARDGIFVPSTVVPLARSGATWSARFDFVVRR